VSLGGPEGVSHHATAKSVYLGPTSAISRYTGMTMGRDSTCTESLLGMFYSVGFYKNKQTEIVCMQKAKNLVRRTLQS